MNCPVAPLEACAHGFLDAEASARVRSHASTCPGCAALLASFERESRAIAAAAAGILWQDATWDRLLHAGLERRRERPRTLFFGRMAMAASLLFCAFVVWSLLRPDPARKAAEPAISSDLRTARPVRQDPPVTSAELEAQVTRAARGAMTPEEIHSVLREIADRHVKIAGTDLLWLLDRPETSAAAAKAISKGGSAEIFREIVRRIDRESQRHYHPATVRILQDADPTLVVPEVLKLLDQEDRLGRARATWVLGELRAQEAVPRIRTFASDRDGELRRCAAFALGNIGAREGIPELLTLLEDRDFNIRCVAAQALTKLKAMEAVPALIRGLRDPEPAYRGEAARSLAVLRSKDAIADLMSALKTDPVESNRRSAATTLAHLGAREAAPGIVDLLDSQDFTTVITALGALRTLEMEEVIPEIVRRRPLFEAAPEFSRASLLRAAALTIGELTARQGTAALVNLLTDGSKDVRLQAARQLCLSGSRAGVPTLLEEDSLESLNALREPDLYKRLDRPFPGNQKGTDRHGLKQLAEAAGLNLDLSAAPHLETSILTATSGGTVREILVHLLEIVRCDYILSEGTLRILPRDSALDEWKAWWAEERKKK